VDRLNRGCGFEFGPDKDHGDEGEDGGDAEQQTDFRRFVELVEPARALMLTGVCAINTAD
jgi:hypothetical protein